jgi:hypothetical protein
VKEAANQAQNAEKGVSDAPGFEVSKAEPGEAFTHRKDDAEGEQACEYEPRDLFGLTAPPKKIDALFLDGVGIGNGGCAEKGERPEETDE